MASGTIPKHIAGWELLWTNTSPTASFPAKTIITGDFSDYKVFLVRFKYGVNSAAERKPFLCFANQTVSAQEPNVGSSSFSGVSRDFTFSASSISCTLASLETTSNTSSNYFIPLYIYGMK